MGVLYLDGKIRWTYVSTEGIMKKLKRESVVLSIALLSGYPTLLRT